MATIQNYDAYCTGLKNTFIDKAFFVEKLPPCINTIIDYGCADGSFLKFLQSIYGTFYNYIGIETDAEMIERCKANGISVYPDIKDVPLSISMDRTCINFSSSLHEMDYPCDFMLSICNDYNPKIISIRDMYFTTEVHEDEKMNLILHILNNCISMYPKKLSDFVKKYPISSIKDCIHFMLKYMYNDNWEKECDEDYLSLQNIYNYYSVDYTPIWEQNYIMPYLLNKWVNDGLITEDISECLKNKITTHIQFIAQR